MAWQRGAKLGRGTARRGGVSQGQAQQWHGIAGHGGAQQRQGEAQRCIAKAKPGLARRSKGRAWRCKATHSKAVTRLCSIA